MDAAACCRRRRCHCPLPSLYSTNINDVRSLACRISAHAMIKIIIKQFAAAARARKIEGIKISRNDCNDSNEIDIFH
jgi:hypothetical protein